LLYFPLKANIYGTRKITRKIDDVCTRLIGMCFCCIFLFSDI